MSAPQMGAVQVGATSITPAPTDDEAVAIVAATEALWPRPMVAAPQTAPRRSAWRFSGRWWSAPLPHRRDRPFR